MKKSNMVSVTFVSVLSVALLSGCSSPSYTRRCADGNGTLMDDRNCQSGVGGGRWIYMGSGSSIVGGRARGFQSSMPGSGEIRSASGGMVRAGSTARGGFGGVGRSSFGG